MAAITFKFGVQSQITPLESRLANDDGALNGLGSAGVEKIEADIIAQTHTALWNMTYLRDACAKILQGRRITVESSGRNVWLVLDKPLPQAPEWNPPTQDGLRRFKLLSWTSKMGAPSFSLPAGAPSIGGSCPGAIGGQTLVPLSSRKKQMDVVKEVTGYAVEPAKAICQHCVTGDTKILVKNRGLVPIEAMVGQGDFEVWSGKAWRTTHAISTGIKPTWKVTTNWGFTTRVSEDHEFIDAKGEKVEVQALEEGDALAWAPGESPFPEAASTNYRPLVQEHPNQLPDRCPTEWSDQVGVFLGMIVADGSISVDDRGYRYVSLGKGADQREELAQVSSWVRAWTSSSEEIVEIPAEQQAAVLRGVPASPATQAYLRLHWKTKSLSNFVQFMGVDKADPGKQRVPPSVWVASHEGARGFLRGYFGADGSVTVTPAGKIEVSAAAVSRDLLQDVQLLLHAFGIKSTLCAYEKSNEWRAREGYRALYKLGINAIDDVRRFDERVGFFAKVKQDRLTKYLKANEDRRGARRTPVVKSVQPTGIEEPVYDLVDVGPELTFSGNGMLHFDCYAEGGQYSTGQVQYAQLMRFAWVKMALEDGTFVPVMDWAVKNANYYLGGKGKIKTDELDENGDPIYVPVRGERDGQKYFRLHDSGDFFSVAYIEAWRRVAELNPDVIFWAPSRLWALGPKMIAEVNRINTPLRNLVIRPSAYQINERNLVTASHGARFPRNPLKRLGTGWAAGTTVYGDNVVPKDMNGDVIEPNEAFDWDCKAYQTDNDKVTCRDARAPDGQIGCRACWKHATSGVRDADGSRGVVVNYTLH